MFVIGIGGEPASGKTTLMRKVMAGLSPKWIQRKRGLLTVESSGRYLVLGDYSQGGFAGTDRLSMAVQPVALDFLRQIVGKPVVVLFEGDRLFNGSFLAACERLAEGCTRWYALDVSAAEVERRHAERADTQGETFLKGRRSKIAKIRNGFDVAVETNDTGADSDRIAADVVRVARSA